MHSESEILDDICEKLTLAVLHKALAVHRVDGWLNSKQKLLNLGQNSALLFHTICQIFDELHFIWQPLKGKEAFFPQLKSKSN